MASFGVEPRQTMFVELLQSSLGLALLDAEKTFDCLEGSTIRKPVIAHQTEYKALAYADDIAVFTADPLTALPEIEAEGHLFGPYCRDMRDSKAVTKTPLVEAIKQKARIGTIYDLLLQEFPDDLETQNSK
ncbi:hypothetical protein NDU88_001826 [Pleurodeles waltl]|uniref:Reverse transcriptase domain-containing protein n=1 Tax=Pleurodeles waltl TaxID=8319 RepID=A0AAV7VB58_PLEWA|nr:hypothetical protein NDU88_001826 [Pleurodeles waltl]